MPGLVPAIHAFRPEDVDGRDKPGHDDQLGLPILPVSANI